MKCRKTTVGRHNIGMLECLNDIGLALKLHQGFRIVDEPMAHHFQRDLPVRLHMSRFVNDPHATLPKMTCEAIATERLACQNITPHSA